MGFEKNWSKVWFWLPDQADNLILTILKKLEGWDVCLNLIEK